MAGRGVQTVRLNKRTGCKSPRCRHCKCRDGLPLVKASHWRIPRRQTGRRSRHKSGDLRKPLESLNKSSSAESGSFSPSVQFQKREIHAVFLRFWNLRLVKNLSLTALADLIRASISRPLCPGDWAEAAVCGAEKRLRRSIALDCRGRFHLL